MGELAASVAYLQRESSGVNPAVPLWPPPAAAGVDYELIRVLGHGGMGVVYEAIQRSTTRRVALKTVHPWIEGSIGALRREAQTLRTIDHPGVVSILDEGRIDSLPFFVMELLDGRTFSTVIAERASRSEGPDVAMLTLLRKVCSTLAFLHQQGIVHRDLNPRNIVLRQAEVPVLVDFGLAGRFAGACGRQRLDVGGVTMGTLAYMAPEQICGKLSDARADLYALGCVLYQVLTGRLPFVESSAEGMMRAHLRDTPKPPSEFCRVPARLEQLALRLLAKRAQDRSGYAEEVGDVLAECGAKDWTQCSARHWRPYPYRAQLRGRGPWLDDFRVAVQRCRAGHGDRWLIAGLRGSGKTRLLGELATFARRQGMCVIAAECSASDSTAADASVCKPATLRSLRPLLRAIADRCRENASVSEQLLGLYGPRLAEYEPEFYDLLGQPRQPTLAHESNDSAQRQIFAALRHALTVMSRQRPVLLAFDDLQSADPLSLEFLSSLSTGFFEQSQLLSIGTYRSDEVSPALRHQLQRAHGAQHRELERLDAEALLAVLQDMLAFDCRATELTNAVRLSAGNPSFLMEYVRTAVVDGRLIRTEHATWAFADARGNGWLACDIPSHRFSV